MKWFQKLASLKNIGFLLGGLAVISFISAIIFISLGWDNLADFSSNLFTGIGTISATIVALWAVFRKPAINLEIEKFEFSEHGGSYVAGNKISLCLNVILVNTGVDPAEGIFLNMQKLPMLSPNENVTLDLKNFSGNPPDYPAFYAGWDTGSFYTQDSFEINVSTHRPTYMSPGKKLKAPVIIIGLPEMIEEDIKININLGSMNALQHRYEWIIKKDDVKIAAKKFNKSQNKEDLRVLLKTLNKLS